MNKIGLVGEDPNDTSSIIFLLKKKFSENFSYKPLIKHIKGYYLENPKTLKSLKFAYNFEKPKIVIVIKDLDDLPYNHELIKLRENWFHSINNEIDKNGILLLNIYELEALIFADINAFNKMYSTSIKQNKNPMFIKEPKEVLIAKSKQVNQRKIYRESHAPGIFENLDFNLVYKNCQYFKLFIDKFLEILDLDKKKYINSN